MFPEHHDATHKFSSRLRELMLLGRDVMLLRDKILPLDGMKDHRGMAHNSAGHHAEAETARKAMACMDMRSVIITRVS